MRPGLSRVDLQEQVSVIQWRHDSFPRFLPRAYPFYLSAFVLMAAVAILVAGLMFNYEPESDSEFPLKAKIE